MRSAVLGVTMVLTLSLIACGGAPTAGAAQSRLGVLPSSSAPATTGAPAAASPPAASPPRPASPAPAASAPTFARGTVTIQTRSGPVRLSVEIADDEPKREYGLMNRSSMPADAGMLFVFDPPANAKITGFWMEDTLIPLSVAFVEPNMVVENVQEMQALSKDIHYAPRDYTFAVEANEGFFARRGVGVGDKVTIQR